MHHPSQGRAGLSNPFTKKNIHMRRNTRDSRCVTLDTEHVRSGERQFGQMAASEAQQSGSVDHNAEASRWRSNSAVLHHQITSPILQAAINNASDLEMPPTTRVQLSSVRSWSSLGSDTANDAVISPRTVTFKDVGYQPEVSGSENEATADQNSPCSTNYTADISAEDRKESNATIFPGFPAITTKREAKKSKICSLQDPPNLAGFFRAAKDIYNVGPQGEGQKLWSSYTGSRKGKNTHTGVKQDLTEDILTYRRPSAPGLSDHPRTGALRSEKQTQVKERVALTETLYPRKESETSTRSCEVPIRIDHANQQYIDRSKPLPPAPLLQPAPKRRPQGYTEIELKPLPLTPRTHCIANFSSQVKGDALPQFSVLPRRPKEHLQQGNKSANIPAQPELVSNTAFHTQQSANGPNPAQLKDKTSGTKASNWWKHLAELTSEDYIPTSSSFKPTAVPLKPTISHPRPITALQEGHTVNLSPSCGGVGGPGAVRPSQPSPRQKGKQKANSPPSSPLAVYAPKHKNWREKLVSPLDSAGLSGDAGVKKSKKRDSGMSFMCAGVEEGGGAFLQDPGPSRQMWGDEVFGGRRDTGFYGAYQEVLEEYER
ncbi:hypothetical protein DE146DRAFT_780218 [Phaeosphaeria sp. MPI-PUGE-AT-0046c]|nr:hypothetical protein DE146DRAFT_780218 [Phaeosphaeria sp. MPI-PUGE-AT-0046c]